MSLANVLTSLRTNNMLNSATKEFGGSNIPHIVLVANKNELVDQAINQFGNTAIVFGGGLIFDKAINALFRGLNPKNFVKNVFRHPVRQQWFMLGKSFAIYSFIASYVMASPFLRNFITLRRTKASNFTEMVGLTQTTHAKDEKALKQKEKAYWQQFIKTWGLGIGISALILGGTQWAISKKIRFPSFFQKLHNIIGLPGGEYKHLKDVAAYAFWAIPAYIGLFTGSRDKLEKKESLYKAAGFGLAFMVLPRTLEHIANRFLKGKTFRGLGPGENVAFLIQLLSGILFYTSIPTVINLFKRRERAEKYGLLKTIPVSKSFTPAVYQPYIGFPTLHTLPTAFSVSYPLSINPSYSSPCQKPVIPSEIEGSLGVANLKHPEE